MHRVLLQADERAQCKIAFAYGDNAANSAADILVKNVGASPSPSVSQYVDSAQSAKLSASPDVVSVQASSSKGGNSTADDSPIAFGVSAGERALVSLMPLLLCSMFCAHADNG